MKPSESRALLGALKAAYPRQPLSTKTLAVYERLLEDLDAEAAIAGVRQHIQTARWFPSVSELRELALGTDRVEPAEVAWESVLREVRRVGIYGQPSFENPITDEAVACVGWRAICSSEMVASERRCFLDAYRVVAGRHKHAMLCEGMPCAPALEGRASPRNASSMAERSRRNASSMAERSRRECQLDG